MIGAVYTGVVVRTSNVSAGKDTCAVVQKSEIVHTEGPFISLNDEGARATILAAAIIKTKLEVGDPANPVEVRITKF